MTPDHTARHRALDVCESFIVQAPAGSGKTELLIQRYLALLARVTVPEQVVAMTFTRKAAAEMRRRVLRAIDEAQRGIAPDESYRRLTFELASAVVASDSDGAWNLLKQPHRLRIETLDALNARLAQHLSIFAGGVGDAEITDRPQACYALAARRTVAVLGSDDPVASPIERLLRATDVSVGRLEGLLTGLLTTRDQWLPYLAGGSPEKLRELLEGSLQRLVRETVDHARAQFPPEFLTDAEPYLAHLAPAVQQPLTAAASDAAAETLGESAALSVDTWQSLAKLFLTNKNSWRMKLTARDGFDASAAKLKTRFLDIVARYRSDDPLRCALAQLRELPSDRYADAEWELLDALSCVLKRLVAELKLTFAERNQTDFVDLALGAQAALGSVDSPSDLLLALDHRIQHILVDEFQDTSHMQLQLLRLLTAGWEPNDGRTLFLVGDPMQSIYRFRHADMSLFLKVCKEGIGMIRAQPLVLEANFRSAPPIVDWVNESFAEIFPPVDDIGAGAARFHPCIATRARAPEHGVCWHMLRAATASVEIDRVTDILRTELARSPEQSIAVLVRSRSHLHGLQERLRACGLSARAIELEPPKHQQIVQDLIGLTRALVHFGDRIAWLGILRAPWCGLCWSDLLKIARYAETQSIWTALRESALLSALSDDGRVRVERTRAVLEACFERRALEPFERWVEATWRLLGGVECLETDDESSSAERFFDALAALCIRGDLEDPPWLEEAFAEPYGEGGSPAGSGIEIMTIHRAKGLEFDTVLVMGLGRQPRPESARALYWLERTADDGSEDLLMAPLRPAARASDTVAEFIRRADAVRDRAERARLLYVATTRARDRLHLVARIGSGDARPPAGSLLEFLWPRAENEFLSTAADTLGQAPASTGIALPLRRLRTLAKAAVPKLVPRGSPMRPEFSWARHAAVQTGNLVHATLHEIGLSGPDSWSASTIEKRRERFERELALRGVDAADIERAAQRVIDALSAVLADSRGRWLLGKHVDAASELSISTRRGGVLEHLRIDRTFVDEKNRRWIVDFKTSVHEGGDVEAFLDSEVERYTDQLAGYAAAMADIDGREIWLGLYFPLLQAFRCWEYAETTG